jgi:DNA primase
MSLPNGFLDEIRARVTLSAIVGRKVTWDARKSNQGKGDFWAACPFHTEKSASFHVDDRKGFYYCFGCHAKGDALSFIKETENLGFMEAVEVLARHAGMAMPVRDPQAAQVADRRSQLIGVMEEAVKWFRLQLRTSAGESARAYLAKRGLSDEAIDRWGIGYAPDSRSALYSALQQKGIAADLIVDAGLCARPDDGSAPYDRFRGRIIFPIRDARGRAISLGGRAMDPNARAKYLNGPETEIFDKGRNLFNFAPAREAVGKGKPLIVAEGYMDVIALSEAGFTASVAPLGTAVTGEQLALMWRIHDEPIIALDGDTAGIRAGLRVVDLALPLLSAGKGLRFANLPAGLDPDDLIKSQGAAAMQGVIDGARPMVALLWSREIEGRSFDSPERKAALDIAIKGHLARMTDPALRALYAEDIKRLRWELLAQKPRPRAPFTPFVPGRARALPELPPSPAAKGSLLASAAGAVPEVLREAVILATLITHPALIRRFETAIERLALQGEGHGALRAVLLTCADDSAAQLHDALQAKAPAALAQLMARPHVRIAPPVRNKGDEHLATLCLAEELAKLDAYRGARREIAEAIEDMDGFVDEGLTWRLAQATAAQHRADSPPRRDAGDLGEDRAAMSNHLQNLIDSKAWEKKSR